MLGRRIQQARPGSVDQTVYASRVSERQARYGACGAVEEASGLVDGARPRLLYPATQHARHA
jgi:hypothetical protein